MQNRFWCQLTMKVYYVKSNPISKSPDGMIVSRIGSRTTRFSRILISGLFFAGSDHVCFQPLLRPGCVSWHRPPADHRRRGRSYLGGGTCASRRLHHMYCHRHPPLQEVRIWCFAYKIKQTRTTVMWMAQLNFPLFKQHCKYRCT